jgi:hypothetical protein
MPGSMAASRHIRTTSEGSVAEDVAIPPILGAGLLQSGSSLSNWVISV